MAVSLGMKRRTLFAAGLGLLAAPAILRTTAQAAATGDTGKMTTALPEINQFKLGSFEITAIRDGSNVLEKPFETFGTNQDPETVKKLLTDNFLPGDKFVNSYSPAIIDTGSPTTYRPTKTSADITPMTSRACSSRRKT